MTNLPTDSTLPVPVEDIDADSFAPFGELIDPPTRGGRVDLPTRLARDPTRGEAALRFITLYPITLSRTFTPEPERHPFSVQAFVPLGDIPLVCLVAPPGPAPVRSGVFRAFRARPGQAIVLREGVWHLGMMCEGRATTALTFIRRLPDGTDTETCTPSGALRLVLGSAR